MSQNFEHESDELIGNGLRKIANAITPDSAYPATDAAGGYVGSLTEAVIGMTAGLVAIATAIHDLADAVRENKG